MNTSWKNKSPVIILLGPTGVGKTRALEESFHTGFEVISADSGQVYRGCDIATAKPSQDLRKKIPHHLIDILDPDCRFTAGDFVRMADAVAKEILQGGNVPVISGGTAFYIKNFLFGLAQAPVSNPEIIKDLEAECENRGLPAMFELLEAVDPQSAFKIGPKDRYRILRALEINRVSGNPRRNFAVPQTPREEYGFLIIGLARDRGELLARINARVDDMFAQGLALEVERLVQQGYTEDDPGLRGIGYAEFFAMWKGQATPDETREKIKIHTRQYAKRQMTFFRKLPGITWFHPDDRKGMETLVREFLGKRENATTD